MNLLVCTSVALVGETSVLPEMIANMYYNHFNMCVDYNLLPVTLV